MKFTFAEHELDLDRRELRRNGGILHVEPQVYDLLVHLLTNRDRVVSKDELLDSIWNGRIVSEAALSSRINAARKAVGDDGDRQALIKTIHRRGFRFIGSVEEQPIPPADEAARLPEANPVEEEARHVSPKPSIAVLPFLNLSREPDTDYFSYGLTEDVIRLLARNRWLDVLSRHSAAAYRNRDLDPREIGTALGVRYLVDGSVAKHEHLVRITADLISAETGTHLWSESYDFELADLLKVQRTMAQQVAAVIEPELARLEREAAVRRPPRNLDAWDCYQRGLWNLWGFSKPGLVEADAMFRRAIELDPGFARAHGALAYVILQKSFLSNPAKRPGLLDMALRHGRNAVALDDQDCMNLCVVGRVLCYQRDHEEAIAYLEQAIAINPSFAQAYFALGLVMVACGQPARAIYYLERATELSPRDPHLAAFHSTRAMAHFSLGELEQAITFARRATRVPNANGMPFATMASAFALMQRSEEAGQAVAKLLEFYPKATLQRAATELFFCDDSRLVQRYLEGLRQAGLPDATPVPAPASLGEAFGVAADEGLSRASGP